jgi:hypothetical protein
MFLDIVLLRTFVAVVEAKGFTRAAGLVNLTQSAVSLHIKRLEEQIGRRLFDRTAPKLATARSFCRMRNASWRLRRRSKPGLDIPSRRGSFDSARRNISIHEHWHRCSPSSTAAIRP